MVGDTGIEPVHHGVKVRCLTSLANPQLSGSDGQDRTADLGVMNPALSPAELHHHGVSYEYRSRAAIFTGSGATITPRTPLASPPRIELGSVL